MSSEQPNMFNLLVPVLMVWGIFYVLVFRPQQQKQKELKNTLDNLKKNDEVVTTGGIHGSVVIVKDKTVVIRVDEHARLEVDREAIAVVKNKDFAVPAQQPK